MISALTSQQRAEQLCNALGLPLNGPEAEKIAKEIKEAEVSIRERAAQLVADAYIVPSSMTREAIITILARAIRALELE